MKHLWAPLFDRLAQAERRSAGDELDDNLPYVRPDDDAATPSDVTMTSYGIRSRRFRRRLLGGLQPEEVIAFLDEVAEAMQTAERENIEMSTQVKLLQDEIHALTGHTSVAATDTFQPVELSAMPMVQHASEQSDVPVTNRLGVLRSTALQEVEALLHDAQARAQTVTDAAHERAALIVREAEALKSQGQQEAEQLRAEASVTAESILMSARSEEAAVREEIHRLEQSRLRLFDDVRATLDACHEWLATVDPRQPTAQP